MNIYEYGGVYAMAIFDPSGENLITEIISLSGFLYLKTLLTFFRVEESKIRFWVQKYPKIVFEFCTLKSNTQFFSDF